MALTDENMVLPVQPMGYGNNNGGFGFGGAAMAMDGGFGLYPWLNNSQNINDGFRDAQLHDSVTSVRDGIQGLSTQLCNCCGDMQLGLANGFNGVNNSIFGAQTAISQQLNTNEIANLNRSFAEQTANMQGFNGVQSGIADLRYTEATEACATRNASAQNTTVLQTVQPRLYSGVMSHL